MNPLRSPRSSRGGRLLAPLLLLASAGAFPHEAQSNRLTIVQREHGHLALTFYVDYVGLLGRTLAPTASRAEFAALCAAMPDARLQHQLEVAHAMFEKELDLRTAAGERLRVNALRWPRVAVAQRLLRDEAMGAIVGPVQHDHPPPLEVTGDALATAPANDIRVTLPRALGSTIVVSYRPVQQQVAAVRGRPFTVRY